MLSAIFAEGLGFDLADAFAREAELLADFFERARLVAIEAEAHPQHGLLRITSQSPNRKESQQRHV